MNDVDDMFQMGADKIALNTVCFENIEIIREISKKYGSQSIVLSVQAKKFENSTWYAFKEAARDNTHIEVKDWKNPPKKIPWSTIVEVQSPFETYKAVWDQDYKGIGCLISCNYYEGFISRWTSDQLALSQFRSRCALGPCRKTYYDISSGVDLLINGETYYLSGQNGLFVLNAKVRRAITSLGDKAKLSISFVGLKK